MSFPIHRWCKTNVSYASSVLISLLIILASRNVSSVVHGACLTSISLSATYSAELGLCTLKLFPGTDLRSEELFRNENLSFELVHLCGSHKQESVHCLFTFTHGHRDLGASGMQQDSTFLFWPQEQLSDFLWKYAIESRLNWRACLKRSFFRNWSSGVNWCHGGYDGIKICTPYWFTVTLCIARRQCLAKNHNLILVSI